MNPAAVTTTRDIYRIDLSPEDYRAAFTEVAFLMDAFASAIDNIMGGVTAPVGRIAGRDTAKKLPVQVSDPTPEGVAQLLRDRMREGFDFALANGELSFGNCVIRDVCRLRGFESGGALCRLFHAYLDGLMDGLLDRPVKSSIKATGETCLVQVETL